MKKPPPTFAIAGLAPHHLAPFLGRVRRAKRIDIERLLIEEGVQAFGARACQVVILGALGPRALNANAALLVADEADLEMEATPHSPKRKSEISHKDPTNVLGEASQKSADLRARRPLDVRHVNLILVAAEKCLVDALPARDVRPAPIGGLHERHLEALLVAEHAHGRHARRGAAPLAVPHFALRQLDHVVGLIVARRVHGQLTHVACERAGDRFTIG